MTNPYLFIVGCPRSGTTLLQRMVNAHPAIAITPESHWIAKFPQKNWTETPEYARWIEVLHRLWPEARFVHLIRDGRDVAMSMREWVKLRPKPGDFVTW